MSGTPTTYTIDLGQVVGSGLPASGTDGDILIRDSSETYNAKWATPATSAIEDSPLPITSGAVYSILGDIATILASI